MPAEDEWFGGHRLEHWAYHTVLIALRLHLIVPLLLDRTTARDGRGVPSGQVTAP